MVRSCSRRQLGMLLLIALALPFRSAVAHPRLVRAVPAAGSHVQSAPRELSVTFNEPLTPALSRLTLLDSKLKPVALDTLRAVPGDAKTLTVKVLGSMSAGRYTVKWQAAGADGHPMRGEYTFVLDAAAGELTTAATSAPGPISNGWSMRISPPAVLGATHAIIAPAVAMAALATLRQTPVDSVFGVESPAYVMIRTIQSIALVGLLGILALHLMILPRFARQTSVSVVATVGAVEQATIWWATTMLWIIGAATMARLIAQHAVFFGSNEVWTRSSLSALLLHSGWGRAWWLAFGATAVGLWGVRRIGRAGARGWPAVAAAALALAASVAMSGHAAAASTLAMTLHTLHVLGAGGWIGSLAALMLVAVPAVLQSGGEERHGHVAGLVRAFSPTALGFVGLLGVTGAIAAWRNIGSVEGLWRESYGQVLLVKLALLSVAAGTGAYNWRRVLPILGSDTATARLRKSSTLELTAALVVLVVTAVLVATPMPSEMLDAMAP